MASLVAAGCGIALLPRLARTIPPPGALRLPVAPPVPVRAISLATRTGAEHSRLLAPLLRAITEHAAQLS